ncbi:hypothetical protein D9619_007960 [Psilocybe cf. subviscida]|uniref:Uncharacterized protein n=1 Tax=Psilocybe cf. subviscida TaxID=2480587 RepID=A0A8H5AUS6_9AGAR|nr:hypothetical protein D9619_007960 [Psilocybe cf. subviscida]
MEATVALLDLLRIILSVMLDDLAACPQGPRLATEAERTFAVLDAPTPASSTNPPVPFLNQTMLADYQHAYSLRQLLSNALKHAQGTCLKTGYCTDNPGTRNSTSARYQAQLADDSIPVSNGSRQGKSRAAPPNIDLSDKDIEILATQVPDTLPDTSIQHVNSCCPSTQQGALTCNMYDVTQRRNVFDDEDIDLSRLNIEKKGAGSIAEEVLHGRSLIDKMKADILRRAEAITDDEEDLGPDEDEDEMLARLRA